MGTVGLNFGSATSGQGFDVASTVSAIIASEQSIETPWKNQLTAYQAQDTVLSTLGSDLSTLTTKMQALTDFSGVLAQKQGASSDNDILTLTSAAATATAGSHTVIVNSLAQTSSDYSDAIANASDKLSGSITIGVGSGTPQTITVDSSSNTLSSLAAAINLAGIGVSASVISDSSGSRLSLVSGTGGAAGQLNVTSNLNDDTTSTGLNIQTGSVGSNGSIKVDGVDLSISSNTVSTAIPGVTFQLLAASAAGTQVQVQITNDNSAIASAMNDVVTAYNAVITTLNGQEGNDANGNPQPLYGSPTVAVIQEQLTEAMLGGVASGSISSVTQLGLTFNQDGTLSFNQDQLNSVLNSNFSDVVGFLQNTNSFGQKLNTALNNLGEQAPNGAIYLAQQQNSAQEKALNDSISAEDARIATDKTNLTTQLNEANQILQSIPSQLNQVDEMYSAITGYNTSQH
jgi:flagellar hook-associated protein 2